MSFSAAPWNMIILFCVLVCGASVVSTQRFGMPHLMMFLSAVHNSSCSALEHLSLVDLGDYPTLFFRPWVALLLQLLQSTSSLSVLTICPISTCLLPVTVIMMLVLASSCGSGVTTLLPHLEFAQALFWFWGRHTMHHHLTRTVLIEPYHPSPHPSSVAFLGATHPLFHLSFVMSLRHVLVDNHTELILVASLCSSHLPFIPRSALVLRPLYSLFSSHHHAPSCCLHCVFGIILIVSSPLSH